MNGSIAVAGGRTLDVFATGPERGPVLLFHHGTPGVRMALRPLVDTALERGLRFVSYTRPGYAGSARLPGRTVADCAADASAVLDHVGATRGYVVGWSGGGPHALACAALLPGRVIAAATIASVAPYPAEGLDWLAGMGSENVREFEHTLEGEDTLRPALEHEAEGLRSVTGAKIVEALGGLLTEVDRATLTGALAEELAANFREAVSDGVDGWLDDDLAFVRPWGFDIGATRVPIAVWQGAHDRMVPPAHGRWLASRVARARARFEPEHGHLSLAVGSFGRVLDDLLGT